MFVYFFWFFVSTLNFADFAKCLKGLERERDLTSGRESSFVWLTASLFPSAFTACKASLYSDLLVAAVNCNGLLLTASGSSSPFHDRLSTKPTTLELGVGEDSLLYLSP